MHPHNKLDLVQRPEAPPSATDVAMAASAAMVSVPAGAASRHPMLVPETQMKPWGSPMEELAPIERQQGRPDNESGWGRAQTCRPGDRPAEVIRAILKISETLTLRVAVPNPPGSVKVQHPIGIVEVPLTCFAIVEWGSGSTTNTQSVRIDSFIDTPLVCSYLSVRVYVGQLDGTEGIGPYPLAHGQTLPETQIAAFAARGFRALPHECAIWLNNAASLASSGVILTKGCRIASLRGHATASAGQALWLQFFDSPTAPGAGDACMTEYGIPAGSIADVGEKLKDLRGMALGLSFGLSTSAGTFTDSGIDAFVEAEQVLI